MLMKTNYLCVFFSCSFFLNKTLSYFNHLVQIVLPSLTRISSLQGKPVWLDLFLRRTFFDSCSVHKLSKNDLNKYCINCDLPVCRYCISSASHGEHKILKIYRHVYKDVVPLCDMEKHIDCSKIQVLPSLIKLLLTNFSSRFDLILHVQIQGYGITQTFISNLRNHQNLQRMF